MSHLWHSLIALISQFPRNIHKHRTSCASIPTVGTSVFLLSWDLAPRYTSKTKRDFWYEFLETLARSEKAHFCLKFRKKELKFEKSNAVVAVRGCHYTESFTQDQKYLRSMDYGVRLKFTLNLLSVRSRFTGNNSNFYGRIMTAAVAMP